VARSGWIWCLGKKRNEGKKKKASWGIARTSGRTVARWFRALGG